MGSNWKIGHYEVGLRDGSSVWHIGTNIHRECNHPECEVLFRPTIDEEHLYNQREWSKKTFGPGLRTKGVINHIKKELKEIEDNPTDLSEWVDVIILAFDGAWRAGYDPEEILQAIIDKQARNEKRNWPDWRTMSEDEAIEHIK